jgi:hypothetical protein
MMAKFIIQGDFLTQSSREGLLTDLTWNQELRAAVVTSFCNAVITKFPQVPTLKYTWFSFLPCHINDPFFKVVETKIFSSLQHKPIFETMNDGNQCPQRVYIVPSRFLDAEGTALIPDECLPKDVHYISRSYPNDPASITPYRRLGVRELNFDQFLGGLEEIDLPSQTKKWHEKVCEVLHDEISRRLSQSYIKRIKNLRMLPLHDGNWVRVVDGEVFLDSGGVIIPDDLGLCLLKIDLGYHRRSLFKRLGIKEADPKEVAQKIRTLHRNIPHHHSLPTVENLVQHALFLFNQDMHGQGIRVFTSAGRIVSSETAYLDEERNSGSIRMTEVLKSPPAHFLHSLYMQQVFHSTRRKKDWISWLRDDLQINRGPRLEAGRLSDEFGQLTKEVDTRKLLVILKENWKDIIRQANTPFASPFYIEQLSDVDVTCLDGSVRKMSATAIRNRALANSPRLSFLPIEDPNNESWAFLAQLGVTMSADAMHYCKLLMGLQEEGSKTTEDILEIYRQLETRFDDDMIIAKDIRCAN